MKNIFNRKSNKVIKYAFLDGYDVCVFDTREEAEKACDLFGYSYTEIYRMEVKAR